MENGSSTCLNVCISNNGFQVLTALHLKGAGEKFSIVIPIRQSQLKVKKCPKGTVPLPEIETQALWRKAKQTQTK